MEIDGKPCSHPGCLNHVTHPCEGCGRVAGRSIEAEVLQAQEPVVWFAFADSNGPVPLELWGFDQKACKNAVLENARSTGWKGTVEGYLLRMAWTIRPLAFIAPQPPAPCPKCAELTKESDYYRINRDITGHAYIDMLNQRNEAVARIARLEDENKKAQQEIAGDIVTIRECDALLKLSQAKVEQQKQWLIERDNYAETLRAEISPLESKVERLLTYVPNSLKYETLQAKVAEQSAEIERLTKERDEYNSAWQRAGEEYRKLRDSLLSMAGEFK